MALDAGVVAVILLDVDNLVGGEVETIVGALTVVSSIVMV